METTYNTLFYHHHHLPLLSLMLLLPFYLFSYHFSIAFFLVHLTLIFFCSSTSYYSPLPPLFLFSSFLFHFLTVPTGSIVCPVPERNVRWWWIVVAAGVVAISIVACCGWGQPLEISAHGELSQASWQQALRFVSVGCYDLFHTGYLSKGLQIT